MAGDQIEEEKKKPHQAAFLAWTSSDKWTGVVIRLRQRKKQGPVANGLED